MRAAHRCSLLLALFATLMWLAGCGANASPAPKSNPPSAGAAAATGSGSGSGGSGTSTGGSGSGGSGSGSGSGGSGSGATANSCKLETFVTNEGENRADNNNVVVIDNATHSITHTVTLSSADSGIAVRAPDKVYVAQPYSCFYCSPEPGSVSVISVPGYAVTATITVGVNPVAVVAAPDGTSVYVADQNSDSVSVIDTATDRVAATIAVGYNPSDLAISPDGKRLYVANLGDIVGSSNPDNPPAGAPGDITVIDTTTNSVAGKITSVTWPQELAASPDGTSLYVIHANEETSLAIVGTSDGSVISDIPIHKGLGDLAVSPDGAFIYLTDSGSWGGTGAVGSWASSLYAVEPATKAVTSVAGGTPGFGPIALTPDGSTAYFIDGNAGSVAVFDTRTQKIVDEVKTSSAYGVGPGGVAVGCMAQ